METPGQGYGFDFAAFQLWILSTLSKFLHLQNGARMPAPEGECKNVVRLLYTKPEYNAWSQLGAQQRRGQSCSYHLHPLP